MSRRNLTSKQHDFLQYLHGHLGERKVWPTYREIVEHFQYRSPNSVTQNLQALAKKGYLRRDHSGYHLVERSGEEATVPVRAALRDGRMEPAALGERLTLAALLPDWSGIHAVRLEGAAGRPAELATAEYVLFGNDDVIEGETAVVLHADGLALRRVGSGGRLEDPAGVASPLRPAEAEVLGPYVGHVGSYGLVRVHPPAAPAPGVTLALSQPVGVQLSA